MNKENKSPTPLSVMLGVGDSFIAKGKSYKVNPIALKDIEEFMENNLMLTGSHLFNIADPKRKKSLNKWLPKYCFDENGNSVSLEIAMNNDWDIVDLKEFIKKLCDISG